MEVCRIRLLGLGEDLVPSKVGVCLRVALVGGGRILVSVVLSVAMLGLSVVDVGVVMLVDLGMTQIGPVHPAIVEADERSRQVSFRKDEFPLRRRRHLYVSLFRFAGMVLGGVDGVKIDLRRESTPFRLDQSSVVQGRRALSG
jgi:hypothetical protein